MLSHKEPIHELIEIIKKTLLKEANVRSCYALQSGKFLQIQLHNGDNYNLCLVKLKKGSVILKR